MTARASLEVVERSLQNSKLALVLVPLVNGWGMISIEIDPISNHHHSLSSHSLDTNSNLLTKLLSYQNH